MKRNVKVGMLLLIPLVSFADDWPQWRGPQGTGISSETSWNPGVLKDGLKTVWEKEVGVGHAAVTTRGGKLYTMGNVDDRDIFHCLDAKTGKEIWTHQVPCPAGNFAGPRATPVLDGDQLLFVNRNAVVFSLNSETGKPNWETDVLGSAEYKMIRWGFSSSPVVIGDLVYVNVGERGAALNKETGKIVWTSPKGDASYASPVPFSAGGKQAVAIFSSAALYAVDAASGDVLWSIPWGTKYGINGADPVFFDDDTKVFVSSGYDFGCAMFDLTGKSPKEIWRNDVLKNQFSSSVFHNGYLYGIDGNNKKKGFLRCIKADDGTVQWSMPIGFGSLMVADNKIIALGEKGKFYIAELTPDGYKEIVQLDTGLGENKGICWTAPVLSGGIIYCRNDKGRLIAVDVR